MTKPRTFKARLGGASKGFKLLKKKRDALKSRFQALLKDIVDTKLKVGESLKDGAFALAKAHYASSGDDIASSIVERAKKPSVTTKMYPDNVAGVSIPVFKVLRNASQEAIAHTMGVGSGGAVLNATRDTYLKAVECIVQLASLQTAFHTLDEEIKMTSRRVNALEYVLIPRIEDIIHYITQEMDEQAREEFFRVKKVVEKKKVKLVRNLTWPQLINRSRLALAGCLLPDYPQAKEKEQAEKNEARAKVQGTETSYSA
ncbi:V-type proton ATPase subunit D (V-ATPase subunit D) (V-ATPase 28 kDa accessory protein) (Vacuolar proton pump subunit D) [Durusdinium trenchii]|uniref:V-type proton ATPase subunit D (V-ATPase subunit D) (V-ATPase 28 kDa accessory protein) (Vacuolar proton pump subunit D) n=1 Tax=Durusdinium trenchii TaxID=1381693 RepID=A0ABP0PP50_9DINO